MSKNSFLASAKVGNYATN